MSQVETAATSQSSSRTDARNPRERPEFWFYGTAAIGFGIKNHAFSYLLLIFCTQFLQLDARYAGLALAIAVIWDAVSDLLLGHLSDKTRSGIGRRHPFMYAALIVLPFSFWAMFHPIVDLSTFSQEGKFLYVLVFALLIRTGTTLFEVPSIAQLPELETDYHKRNGWLALRQFFGWFGGNGIHTVNMFFWVGAYGFTVSTGYTLYAVVGAGCIALTIVFSSLGTQKYFRELPKPTEPFRFKQIFKEILQIAHSLKNRNFAALFINSLVSGMAGGLGAALYLYNVSYYFAFSGMQIAVTGIFVLLGPAIAYGLISYFSLTVGNKKKFVYLAIWTLIVLYPLPYVLYLVGFWPPLGSDLSLAIYSTIIVTEVVCLVINATMLDSMMADIVEDSESSDYPQIGRLVLRNTRIRWQDDFSWWHHFCKRDRCFRWDRRHGRFSGHDLGSSPQFIAVLPAVVLRIEFTRACVPSVLHNPRR